MERERLWKPFSFDFRSFHRLKVSMTLQQVRVAFISKRVVIYIGEGFVT